MLEPVLRRPLFSRSSQPLRALAGIYPLAAGDMTVVGRIGTLLDVGLGFEGESTGRENIYYRGMTMGYSRKQLRAVEEEIVKFADLGDFIDLPMRTYSAGMIVRLGFAISTQFHPDILLVDEVFGAGDAAAQASVERYAARLARALAQVINLLDPDVIVLGGGMSNVAALYDAVPRLWAPQVFSDSVRTVLAPARHGDSSGVRGAAWLAARPEVSNG